jgi:hypothetical protein
MDRRSYGTQIVVFHSQKLSSHANLLTNCYILVSGFVLDLFANIEKINWKEGVLLKLIKNRVKPFA